MALEGFDFAMEDSHTQKLDYFVAKVGTDGWCVTRMARASEVAAGACRSRAGRDETSADLISVRTERSNSSRNTEQFPSTSFAPHSKGMRGSFHLSGALTIPA